MSKSDEFKRIRGQMLDIITELQQVEASTVQLVEETREELEQNDEEGVAKGTTIH
jgi:uncharacterized protein YacL